MIRDDDFTVDIGHDDAGTYVRIVHLPTGNERTETGVDHVGRTQESLRRELLHLVYQPEEIRVDTIRAKPVGLIRVTHVPSGASRTAEHTGAGRQVIEDLLDAVLEDLHAADGP